VLPTTWHRPGTMKIRIYNEVGHLVYSTLESKLAGAQGSNFDAGNMAPGVYVCLLSVNYNDGSSKHYTKIKFAVTH